MYCIKRQLNEISFTSLSVFVSVNGQATEVNTNRYKFDVSSRMTQIKLST